MPRMFKAKSWFSIVLIIIVVLGSYYIYKVPLEKAIAMQAYDHHLESQGISKAEITELKVFKEYNFDKTAVIVCYQNDPFTYNYRYNVQSFSKGKIRVSIYNERNESIGIRHLIPQNYRYYYNQEQDQSLSYSPKDYFIEKYPIYKK